MDPNNPYYSPYSQYVVYPSPGAQQQHNAYQVPYQPPPQLPPQVPYQSPPQPPVQVPYQPPPQLPPQFPYRSPPQVPYQPPHQPPAQVPYQVPYQSPPQLPPQVSYQSPPQLPPQVPYQSPPQPPVQVPYQTPPQLQNQQPGQFYNGAVYYPPGQPFISSDQYFVEQVPLESGNMVDPAMEELMNKMYTLESKVDDAIEGSSQHNYVSGTLENIMAEMKALRKSVKKMQHSILQAPTTQEAPGTLTSVVTGQQETNQLETVAQSVGAIDNVNSNVLQGTMQEEQSGEHVIELRLKLEVGQHIPKTIPMVVITTNDEDKESIEQSVVIPPFFELPASSKFEISGGQKSPKVEDEGEQKTNKESGEKTKETESLKNVSTTKPLELAARTSSVSYSAMAQKHCPQSTKPTSKPSIHMNNSRSSRDATEKCRSNVPKGSSKNHVIATPSTPSLTNDGFIVPKKVARNIQKVPIDQRKSAKSEQYGQKTKTSRAEGNSSLPNGGANKKSNSADLDIVSEEQNDVGVMESSNSLRPRKQNSAKKLKKVEEKRRNEETARAKEQEMVEETEKMKEAIVKYVKKQKELREDLEDEGIQNVASIKKGVNMKRFEADQNQKLKDFLEMRRRKNRNDGQHIHAIFYVLLIELYDDVIQQDAIYLMENISNIEEVERKYITSIRDGKEEDLRESAGNEAEQETAQETSIEERENASDFGTPYKKYLERQKVLRSAVDLDINQHKGLQKIFLQRDAVKTENYATCGGKMEFFKQKALKYSSQGSDWKKLVKFFTFMSTAREDIALWDAYCLADTSQGKSDFYIAQIDVAYFMLVIGELEQEF